MPILFQNERVSYNDNHFMNLVETALSYGGREITVANGVIENISGKVNVNPWIVAAKIIGTVSFPIFVLIAYLIRESYRARLTIESDNAKMQRSIQEDELGYLRERLHNNFMRQCDRIAGRWHFPLEYLEKPFNTYLKSYTIVLNKSPSQSIFKWKYVKLELEGIKNTLPVFNATVVEAVPNRSSTFDRDCRIIKEYFESIEKRFEFLINLTDNKIKLLELSSFIKVLQDNESSFEEKTKAYDFIMEHGTVETQELATDLFRPYLPLALVVTYHEKVETFFHELLSPPRVPYAEPMSQNDEDIIDAQVLVQNLLVEIKNKMDILKDNHSSFEEKNSAYEFILQQGTLADQEIATDLFQPSLRSAPPRSIYSEKITEF